MVTDDKDLADRGNAGLEAFGVARPGVSVQQANVRS